MLWSQEASSDLPHSWQECAHLSQCHCLPKSVLADISSYQLLLHIKHRLSDSSVVSLTTRLNACPRSRRFEIAQRIGHSFASMMGMMEKYSYNSITNLLVKKNDSVGVDVGTAGNSGLLMLATETMVQILDTLLLILLLVNVHPGIHMGFYAPDRGLA